MNLTKPRIQALHHIDQASLAESALESIQALVPGGTLSALERGGYIVIEAAGIPSSLLVCLTDRGRRALARLQQKRTDLPGLVARARARLREVFDARQTAQLLECVTMGDRECREVAAAALCAVPAALWMSGAPQPRHAVASSSGCVVVSATGPARVLAVMHPGFVQTNDVLAWMSKNVRPQSLGVRSLPHPARWRYFVTTDGEGVVEGRFEVDVASEERRAWVDSVIGGAG